MRPLEARDGFAMGDVSPALRFSKPLPTVLCIHNGALSAQQLHITAACQKVHGHLPGFDCLYSTPAERSAPYAREYDSFIKSV
jgi:hypothetical protein